jgi:hypothetical protein
VAGQRVGGVRATDHDQLGSERAEPLDLLHALDGLAGVDRAQRRPVQQPIEGCLGDRPQVLILTARKIQVEPARVCGGGNAPSWPWRAISSARSRAAWLMRNRCASTDHAAAS